MSVLNCLAELHQEPDLKLTLKFEVEVLCKTLNINLQVIFFFKLNYKLSFELIIQFVMLILISGFKTRIYTEKSRNCKKIKTTTLS